MTRPKHRIRKVLRKLDDNPEHIRLMNKSMPTGLLHNGACDNLRFDGVPGHLFILAKLGKE